MGRKKKQTVVESNHEYIPPLASGKPDLNRLMTSNQLFKKLSECRNAELPELLWGHYLARKRIHLQVGKSGCRKTSFNWALHYALQQGQPFLGITGHPCKVLYLDGETDEGGMKGRGNLLGFNWGLEFPDFRVADVKVAGCEFFDLVPFIKSELIDKSWAPDLIYIDPLSIFFDISDKDNQGAASVMNKLRHVCQELNCGIVLVHHPGKIDRQDHDVYSGRGASNWGNLADCVWNFYGLGLSFSEDAFILDIPKARFADDDFFQCITTELGEFTPCDPPPGWQPEHSNQQHMGGVKTFQRGQDLMDYVLNVCAGKKRFTVAELKQALDIQHNPEIHRMLRPLIQSGKISKIAHGLYEVQGQSNRK